MSWQLEELELAASLVLKEERNNEQGKRLESSDPHEFEESDDSTETDEDGDEDEDGDGDEVEDEDGDVDDTNDKDDDDVVDDGRGHDENVKGIITKADFSTDSKEPGSLLGNNNDKETDL